MISDKNLGKKSCDITEKKSQKQSWFFGGKSVDVTEEKTFFKKKMQFSEKKVDFSRKMLEKAAVQNLMRIKKVISLREKYITWEKLFDLKKKSGENRFYAFTI